MKKILMLVNWKIEYCHRPPQDKQPPDYYVFGQPYWFFRYFQQPVQVDVLDIRSFSWLENLEKEKLRFYVIQALRAIPKLHRYDLVISHGMQSGVVVSLFRRLFSLGPRHVVFDIGSFNSAAESGFALRLMQFASRSIDGLIYHTSGQLAYYQQFFPWIVERSVFIPFGTDSLFFQNQQNQPLTDAAAAAVPLVTGIPPAPQTQTQTVPQTQTAPYLLCVGYAKRDWATLWEAFVKVRQTQSQSQSAEAGHAGRLQLKLIGKEQVDDLELEPEAWRADLITMPYIPIRQLIAEINGALLCILPLQRFLYSYGQMTLLQQMALGKAVIAAQVPSLADYGQDGETLLFYQPGDSDDLAAKILRLLADSHLRLKIGQQAAESVAATFHEKNMAVQVERFLDSI